MVDAPPVSPLWAIGSERDKCAAHRRCHDLAHRPARDHHRDDDHRRPHRLQGDHRRRPHRDHHHRRLTEAATPRRVPPPRASARTFPSPRALRRGDLFYLPVLTFFPMRYIEYHRCRIGRSKVPGISSTLPPNPCL